MRALPCPPRAEGPLLVAADGGRLDRHGDIPYGGVQLNL